MRKAMVGTGALLALSLTGGALANDTLQEMTDKIDRAAEVMGEPHDAVSPALRDAFPGVDVVGHAPCVAQHATPAELTQLGGTTGTGGIVVGEGLSPSEIAASIAARPATRDCFSQSGLPALPE